MSHLVELRSRLMRSIVAVFVVLLVLFPFAKDIYALLAQPLLRVLPQGSTMIATDVTGTFLVPLKVTLMAAFLIALPYVLWQAWAFVAPGLYHHEKRLVLPVLVSSCLFFALGMMSWGSTRLTARNRGFACAARSMQPVTTSRAPGRFASARPSATSIDSCRAASMKAQVFTTTRSASPGVAAGTSPSASSVATTLSESTAFFGQPRVST